EDSTEKVFKVGAVSRDFNSPFQARLKLGMELAVQELSGIELDIRDGESDPNVQTNIIETFIAQKKDMILITPAQLDALVPVVKKCNEAGIPVITVNTKLGEGGKILTYVGADDVDGGRVQGKLVNAMLNGKGNIALIQGTLGSSPQVMREQGLEKYLSLNAPDIKIVAKQNNDWDNAKTVTIVQNLLTRFPEGELDGIVLQGPYDAIAAADTCRSVGRTELLGKIVAFDLPQEVIDAINEGALYGSVLQDPQEQGSLSVKIAYEYLTGKNENIALETWTALPAVDKNNVQSFGPAW
ncbi:MAG: sugar ABC transporter substrate-binding protein, partial [Clostridia bacterium]|nr:sugar ABC transporter substrate-binding protein [Clostridia bacterium]